MTAATISQYLSGALIALRALAGTFGINRKKLAALIRTALVEGRDVGADEVQALIDGAKGAIDKLDDAIEAKETGE